ncbi:RASD1-like protein [Mya arenaria]|uniref:RASD1-like protein n=1 Tax=Mya arenaria TaxID=6604 RepID=A0ABY7DGW9_MYAAR|nr:RASD1-like protein [Mya arenaria]
MELLEQGENAPHENCRRLVILGSRKVGKTAIVSRFLNYKFDEKYTPTIEDFHRKIYKIKGKAYRLDILDSSGNHPFPAIRRLSFITVVPGAILTHICQSETPKCSCWTSVPLAPIAMALLELGENAPDNNCKRLVILGSSKVGKTAIVSRFLNNKFDENYTSTIEDFHRKIYKIKGKAYRLDIFDSSGNHPFPAMRRLSFITDTALCQKSITIIKTFVYLQRTEKI